MEAGMIHTNVAPSISFADFMANVFTWKQGEHITMVGPTGEGKTTLAQRLLPRRDFVTVFGVKPRDDTMMKLVRNGWKRQEKWDGTHDSHIVLWPKIRGTDHESQYKQRTIFSDAINRMYGEEGWCMCFDEGAYMADFLGMARSMQMLLYTSRASGISVVCMTQRPRFIPVAFYDQPTHLFFWGDTDDSNVKRLGEMVPLPSKTVREIIPDLQHREVLYIRTRHPRAIVRTVVKLRPTS